VVGGMSVPRSRRAARCLRPSVGGRVRASVRGRDGPAGGDAHWSERRPSDACSPRARARACVRLRDVRRRRGVRAGASARRPRRFSCCACVSCAVRSTLPFVACAKCTHVDASQRQAVCALRRALLYVFDTPSSAPSSLCLSSSTSSFFSLTHVRHHRRARSLLHAASMGFKPTPAIRRCTRARLINHACRARGRVPKTVEGGWRRGGEEAGGRVGGAGSSSVARRRRCAR